MTPSALLASLRAAGDPLSLAAAGALIACSAEIDRLQERVYQLKGIARLNVETIRSMQRAAAEATSALYQSSTTNGDSHASR